MSTAISSWTGLAAMSLSGDYYLTADLSSSDADYISAGGNNWTPIGTTTNRFTGNFDGRGHTISNLIVNKPTTDYVGLFGFTAQGIIKNIGVISASVTGQRYVGILVGSIADSGRITKCWTTGSITGRDVGGLVGYTSGDAIVSKSYSSANVILTAGSGGGFVGWQSSADIEDCYATGNITASSYPWSGGFAGIASAGGSITRCYATGNIVSSATNAGGLIGSCNQSVSDCYATGNVTGLSNSLDDVGPLIGISNASAVYGNNWYASDATIINNGTGGVTNTDGGSSTTRSNFYDHTFTVYTDFNFVSNTNLLGTWVDGSSYPTLRSSLNLSGVNSVAFDVYSSRTGSNLKFGLNNVPGEMAEQAQEARNTYKVVGDISGYEFRTAQSFKVTSSVVTSVEIYQDGVVGSPSGNIELKICPDTSGHPDIINPIAQVSVTPVGTGILKGTFSSPITLTPGTTYWLYVNCSGQSTSNYFKIGAVSSSLYANGNEAYYYDANPWVQETGVDLYFKIYVIPEDVTTEITPNITQINTWQTVTWNLSGVADEDKNNIDQFIITVVNADAENTFYVDNFRTYEDPYIGTRFCYPTFFIQDN